MAKKGNSRKKQIVKVIKYELKYESGCADFNEMQNELWKLQRQTREVMNRTIQLCYHWSYVQAEYCKQHGSTLKPSDVKPCDVYETNATSIDGYIYQLLKVEYPDFFMKNLSATLRKAHQKYDALLFDIHEGNASIPSFKKDQPLIFEKKAICISKCLPDKRQITLFCFSKPYKSAHPTLDKITFTVRARSASEKSIFDNIINGKYTFGESQLVYEKKKWFFLLSYKFTPESVDVNPEKVLGVDLGVVNALCAGSVENPHDSLFIKGTEAIEQIRRLEARKRDLQKQARYPGDGRIGHGTKTRVSPVYQTRDAIARMQDTLNHRWSRALIDFACKNGYGTIQMEDLSGIKALESEKPYLKHWTYFDLQSKIIYKAEEQGIRVVKVNPKCTSRRCSACGYISKENRKNQAEFLCVNCGYHHNADYNAAQNLSIPQIDRLIEKQLKEQESEENEAGANPK